MWSKAQTSFDAGELSPLLSERSDIPRYMSGASLVENFVVLPQGGVYRRPGTEFVAETKNSGQARLIPFNYSTGDTYVLEFGNLYIRFFRNGAPVLDVNSNVYELVSPWTSAQLRDIQYVQVNDVLYLTHPDTPVRRLERSVDNQYLTFGGDRLKFKDHYLKFRHLVASSTLFADWALTEVWADNEEIRTGLTYPPFLDTNAGPTTIKVKDGVFATWSTDPVAPAYNEGKKITHEGVLYISTASHTGEDPTTFQADLANGWWRHVGYDGGTHDIITLTSTDSVWDEGSDSRYIPAGSFMEISAKRAAASVSLDISAVATSDILTGVFGVWNVRTYGTWNATIIVERSYDAAATWETVAEYVSQSDRNVDSESEEVKANAWYRVAVTAYTSKSGTQPRVVLEVQDQLVSGVVEVVTVTTSTEADVRVLNLYYSGEATTEWREGAFNSNEKYPRSVAVHEQRIYYGGTAGEPQSLWGSEVDNFEWFKPGGTQDADPVNYIIASGDQNRIEWMVSKKKMVVGTAGAEWTLGSSSDDTPVTPTNVVVKRHSSFGSKHLQAIPIGEAVLFAQRGGRKVREFTYSFENDGYMAPDMTRLADHLSSGGILEWAYQQQRDQLLWCITGDGLLTGFTYERLDNVLAWHRHTTDGTYESVACVYGTLQHDELWLIVKRTINGITRRCIERFDPLTWDYEKTSASKNNYLYLDCASRETPAGALVTGLGRLEGKWVDILTDGGVHPQRQVVGGRITLDAANYTLAIVGLGYNSRLQPMRLVTPAPAGTSQGRERKAHELVFYLHETLGGTYSPKTDGSSAFYDIIPSRDSGDDMDDSPPLYSGDAEVKLHGGWGNKGLWELRQAQPFPMTLLSVVTKFNVPGNP